MFEEDLSKLMKVLNSYVLEDVKVEPKLACQVCECDAGQKDGCWPPDEKESFIREKDALYSDGRNMHASTLGSGVG